MSVTPYPLMTCAQVSEILNLHARGEQELLEGIEEVEAESIYYHTHSHYLPGKERHDRYLNDFAAWVAEQVRDRVLSERLAVVDPWALASIEGLRRELVTLVEDHIEKLGFAPRALFGDRFEFMRAHLIVLPTGVEVRTRRELRDALGAATAETLYYHFFEDAFRKGRRTGSLVEWVAGPLGDEALALELAKVNPYRLHLESLRADLESAFERLDRRAA